MADGVTSHCVFCGETMDFADHMNRLDAAQTFTDWLHNAVPGANFRADTKGEACRQDPTRAYEALAGVSSEELKARMRGA